MRSAGSSGGSARANDTVATWTIRLHVDPALHMDEPLLLGAIADDYTGAADLASMLREQGLRTGLLFGSQPESVLRDVRGIFQALVIALRTRSAPVATAREESLDAWVQLRRLGARQLYFKYCSTFDSTRQGNIGPVIDALMTALDTDLTVAVPALPVNGRTLYQGYLFVGDSLLSESHMRHHPVTPMTESNLVRHLQAQTARRVGLIAHPCVRSGASAIRREIRRHREQGVQIALVDAIADDDLRSIAEAVSDLPLITGSSGLGMTLPAAWVGKGLSSEPGTNPFEEEPTSGGVLILSGSCSSATLEQLAALQAVGGSGLGLDVSELLSGESSDVVDRLFAALRTRLRASAWALVYSSASAEERMETLRGARATGIEGVEISRKIEWVMGELARRSVAEGLVDSLIVAGGETTGAVTQALDVTGLEIGPALDPGVPVARSIGPKALNLIFKSGNFGAPDFFLRALRYLGLAGLDSPPRTGPRAPTGA